MDVLSNISQPSPISPYTQDSGTGGGDVPNQQYPCNSSSFSKNHPAGGFTLLQGHIKLMAMVPHLPENHLSEKILRPSMQPAAPTSHPSAHDCHAYPCSSSHSLPPITPRMMPSTISQKYQQYLHNNQTFWNGSHARTFPHENGYPEQFPYSSGGPWYPTNYTPESPYKLPPVYPHRQIAMMPSFENTANGNDFGMKPFMDNSAYLDSSPPINNPYQHPWLSQHLAYQQMMAAHSRSHFIQQHLNTHQYPHPFQQSQPYSNEAFPPSYSHPPHQHPHFPPYAAQSLPDFFTAPPMNHFGMSPCACQSCCSLPVLPPPPTSEGRLRTKGKKKHRNSPGSTESEDVFIAVEESEETTSSSSSTSLSSTEQPQIVPKTASKPIVVSPQHDETLPPKNVRNLDEKENKSEPQILPSTAKGKQKAKESPLVVTVHDCFASDSSEAEIDPDASSDLDKGPHFRKKKLPPVKPIRKPVGIGGGNIHIAGNGKVFEDLENDLSPDEVRTYTSEYLVELLTSQDWNNCYIALQIMVRFARHRPQALLNYVTNNGVILWYTYNHITSPKSALCRAAIVTFKELFVRIPSSLDNQIDKIAEKLVMKSLAPNNFIRKECDDALMAMIENCNLAKILSALENIRKKQHTRAAGLKVTLARMALQIILTAGVDNCLMNQPYAEKLLPMLFCFMMEPNIETRSFAKQALSMLMNHLQFEAAVMRHVSFDRNSTEVFKKLDKMRGRNRKLK